MKKVAALPLGQHRLDYSADFDPIRSILYELWIDLFWACERVASLPWLDPGPVERGSEWLAYVNEAVTEAELSRLRQSVQRGVPYGSEGWVKATAARLGLEFTQRSRGRPRGPVQRESGEADLFGEKE